MRRDRLSNAEQKLVDWFGESLKRLTQCQRTNSIVGAVLIEEQHLYLPAPAILHKGIGEWLVVCFGHLEQKRFSGRRVAFDAVSHPEIFCSKCREYLDPAGLELEFK